MAERMLRWGLPRVAGGEGWPPAGISADVAEADAVAAAVTASVPAATDAVSVVAASTGSPAPSAPREETAATAAQTGPSASAARAVEAPVAVRRGLPRIAGGEPWPSVSMASAAAPAGTAGAATGVSVDVTSAGSPPVPAGSAPAATGAAPSAAVADDAPAVAVLAASVAGEHGPALRRGLPRMSGGEPWPPAGTHAASAPSADAAAPAAAGGLDAGSADSAPVAANSAPSAPAVSVGTTVSGVPLSVPLPFTRTVWPGAAPRRTAAPPASPGVTDARPRRRPTWTQAFAALFAAAGLGIVAGAAIAFVRAFLTLPFMQDFLAMFPGEYHSPANPAPGFPAWIGWQHFFNVFLMVLIIRSGLRVRSEKRPTVFWTPRGNPKGKISLTLWFHQALDILWLVNGVVFVVLLFVSGHWARIVPTSWEVFPNALSAALQYVSFDWPTENGWVNYNSLQQLAYFTTVFLAAPLAAVTGFRMSGMWPKKAERLSKAYPVEWARAVHFPVMLYFVGFIVVHVALVMLTGFLRNLNHMYAAQDAVTWTGFWVFVASLVVIAAAWIAARPLVLAPIAKVFGNVSGR
ncbi:MULTISPECIES: cytochrome b/b6 domain-containing protein [Bacteria]|uniref:cytochrome b/b6 domain-containing protein n=1 Tax=Bacteria TaxID=2 RepID=UPI003C7EC4E5